MANINAFYAGLGLFLASSLIFVLHLLIFRPAKSVRIKMVIGVAMMWLIASIIMWPVTSEGAVPQLLFTGLLGFSIARQLYDPSCREAQ